MKFRTGSVFVGMAVVLGAIATLRAPGPSRLDLRTVAGSCGTLTADWLWLKANLAWERHDAARTRRYIELTVAADPGSRYFWVNGARILAYDLPAWRSAGEPRAPGAMHHLWHKAAAREALQLLERGLSWHGNSAVLRLEMANISLYALGDRSRAAEYYRLASVQPDAPPYAARLAARLGGARP